MFGLILFVLFSVGYYNFRQAAVEVGSPNVPPATGAVAPKTYAAKPANVVATSEKPAPPIGLPLAELGVICNVPHDKNKRVALTFDDGPSLKMTPEYLKVLQEKGAHATFFLIGYQVQSKPNLVVMIAGSGNEIGNHTYSHLNLKIASISDATNDIAKGESIIEQESHQKISLLRPPGGGLNVPVIRAIQKLGYTIVFWDIDPQDWREDATPEQIINNVMTNLRPGSIILLHEGKLPTLNALPQLIDDIKKQGYEIGTVSELLAQPNPPRIASTDQSVMTQAPPGGAPPGTQGGEVKPPESSGGESIMVPDAGAPGESVRKLWAKASPAIKADAEAKLDDTEYQKRRGPYVEAWANLQGQLSVSGDAGVEQAQKAIADVLALIDKVYGFPGYTPDKRQEIRDNTDVPALIAQLDQKIDALP